MKQSFDQFKQQVDNLDAIVVVLGKCMNPPSTKRSPNCQSEQDSRGAKQQTLAKVEQTLERMIKQG